MIIRGLKVLLDSDLAALYQVETKILNKAVRVETGIVSDDFMFQLTREENAGLLRFNRYPKDFSLALSAADIERAHRQHKIAGLLGMEGGHAIEDSPRLLRDYYRLGVRT